MPDNTGRPIVLAHGITRFDFISNRFGKKLPPSQQGAADKIHYFKLIATGLRAEGHKVFHSDVSFAGDVEARATQLAAQVERALQETGADKAHIIGHSMGGLDARHMIVNRSLGMSDKVASVTTIGTPHNGTYFADWGLANGRSEAVLRAQEIFDLEIGGFDNLTRESCRRFNDAARNDEAKNPVVYQTFASSQDRRLIFLLLQGPWRIISEKEGANDGLVPVSSQRWVSELVADDGTRKKVNQFDFPVSADHLNEVGWWDLEEINALNWWNPFVLFQKLRPGANLVKSPEDFERSIRNIYLDIARNLPK